MEPCAIMANQSSEEGDQVPNNILGRMLLTVLPFELRLQIYEDVFRGSRVRLVSITPRIPLGKSLTLRPSHHHQLLFVCHQIYNEALFPYWSSTVIDSALNPPFESATFSEVMLSISGFAQPVVREIRCKGFRESEGVPGLNFKQFVGQFPKIETVVMEPAFLYVSRGRYDRSTWSADMVLSRARGDLRRRYPMFGSDGPGGVRILQRVQFPVYVRSRGMQIRLGARNKNYPAKVRLYITPPAVHLKDFLTPQ